MQINKSLLTNIIALLLFLLSFAFDGTIQQILLFGGLFALSGSLTNLLAIHMLFEKVPFLYGSGVISARFTAFKDAIKDLIMTQFFTKEQLNAFFEKEEKKINLTPLIEEADFSPAYDALTKTVMESSFGGMLGMFGGEKALEGLREPFTNKLKTAVITIVNSQKFNDTLQKHIKTSSLSDDMLRTIEDLVDARLAQLTPKMVKELVQKLIKEHLSWLVVWGGVFGGVIGVLSSFLLSL